MAQVLFFDIFLEKDLHLNAVQSVGSNNFINSFLANSSF